MDEIKTRSDMTKPASNSGVLPNQGPAGVSDEGWFKQRISKLYLFCKSMVSAKHDTASPVLVEQGKNEELDKMERGEMVYSPKTGEKVGAKPSGNNYVIGKILQANELIEKAMNPRMGLVLLGAVMANVYQIITSGMVKTDTGKTLLKLNQVAVMMLFYGFVMPNRVGGHIAMAIGVAFVVVAYLATLGFFI